MTYRDGDRCKYGLECIDKLPAFTHIHVNIFPSLFFRIHILEEQLRDVELKSQKKIQEEEKRTREFMVNIRCTIRWHSSCFTSLN